MSHSMKNSSRNSFFPTLFQIFLCVTDGHYYFSFWFLFLLSLLKVFHHHIFALSNCTIEELYTLLECRIISSIHSSYHLQIHPHFCWHSTSENHLRNVILSHSKSVSLCQYHFQFYGCFFFLIFHVQPISQ